MLSAPSISAFEAALKHPHLHMRTLRSLKINRRDPCWLERSTFFAEARVVIDGKRWMICAPLKINSFDLVMPGLRVARQCSEGLFPAFHILHDEMMFYTEDDDYAVCDLLLVELPDGISFEEAPTMIDTRMLRKALADLKAAYIENGIVQGNIKPANLIFGRDGRLHPLRFYYLLSNMPASEVDKEFRYLELHIDSFPVIERGDGEDGERGLSADVDEMGFLRGMFRRIRRDGLFGFVDENGRTVIEPRFVAADDFYENRSVVNTPSGEGVIDTSGSYIIPPQYDMVDYDIENGQFLAYTTEGECLIFDYSGKRIG